MATNKLDIFNKAFNDMLDVWSEIKKAKKDHKKGELSSEELFDIEFNAFEIEQRVIKLLEK